MERIATDEDRETFADYLARIDREAMCAVTGDGHGFADGVCLFCGYDARSER